MGRKPGKKFSEQVGLRLEPLMTDVLRREADKRDISISTFIRLIIKDWLRKKELAESEPKDLQI